MVLIFQKRREKGRIDLDTVYSVERTFISLLRDDKGAVPQGYDCPFLIGYHHQGNDYVLHLVVRSDEDRLVWICKLREGNKIYVKQEKCFIFVYIFSLRFEQKLAN